MAGPKHTREHSHGQEIPLDEAISWFQPKILRDEATKLHDQHRRLLAELDSLEERTLTRATPASRKELERVLDLKREAHMTERTLRWVEGMRRTILSERARGRPRLKPEKLKAHRIGFLVWQKATNLAAAFAKKKQLPPKALRIPGKLKAALRDLNLSDVEVEAVARCRNRLEAARWVVHQNERLEYDRVAKYSRALRRLLEQQTS